MYSTVHEMHFIISPIDELSERASITLELDYTEYELG